MIDKLIEYFEEQLEISGINCDFLSDKVGNFSIEPLSTQPINKEFLDGTYIGQLAFAFASRVSYSIDKARNLLNNEFGINLMNLIKENNENSILPDIEGIESIEVTSTPFAYQTGINTARYQINMKITYFVE